MHFNKSRAAEVAHPLRDGPLQALHAVGSAKCFGSNSMPDRITPLPDVSMTLQWKAAVGLYRAGGRSAVSGRPASARRACLRALPVWPPAARRIGPEYACEARASYERIGLTVLRSARRSCSHACDQQQRAACNQRHLRLSCTGAHRQLLQALPCWGCSRSLCTHSGTP